MAALDVAEPKVVESSSVWRRIAPFLVLSFGLTWLLDLAIVLYGGASQSAVIVALQLQMMIPAASAILLGLYSPRYGSSLVRESSGRARAFFYFVLILTAVYVVMTVAAMAAPSLATGVAGIGQILTILGVLGMVVLRLADGRESFHRAGLTFGKPINWLTYGLGFVLLYSLLTALNAAFGLGAAPDLSPYLSQMPLPVEAFLVVAAIQTVVVGPFLGILISFGEEYGWRGYLQGELVKIGRVRGVAAVGVIWGLWHAPIIAMGHNYPGYPIVGIFLMVAVCVFLAFVLGYAVLKTGSVWLAAFLHAVNNQALSFLVLFVYTPSDPVFQFAGGLYGLAAMLVVVLIILRDPVWRGAGQRQTALER